MTELTDDNFVRVDVYVRLPWARDEKVFSYKIGRFQAEEALTPLPKDRELIPSEMFEAQRKHERRQRLIDLVSSQIAIALMSACESEDTVNGYRTAPSRYRRG